MPKTKISKSESAIPQKPAVKTPEKPQETPQEIIARAQKEVRRIGEQMKGLGAFCYSVDEGGGGTSLYDFSCALNTMLDCIAEHAEAINETLNQAAAQLQKGGTQ